MNDVASEIEAINRSVGRRSIATGDGRSVVLRRSYAAPIEDVWDACSDPDRLKRWFLPVTGDLRLGGRFQIEGNPGGGRDHRARARARLGAGDGRRPGRPDRRPDRPGADARVPPVIVLSSTAWGAALEAAGMASAAEAAAVVERTTAFYAPGLDEGPRSAAGPAAGGGPGR